MEGTCSPSPVRRVMIPKGKGEYRSHGFRPRRSAHHAIEQMHAEALAKGKKCDVVDCDLKAFFDTVDHQKLMVAPPHEALLLETMGETTHAKAQPTETRDRKRRSASG